MYQKTRYNYLIHIGNMHVNFVRADVHTPIWPNLDQTITKIATKRENL